jgi:hypothetical protein
MRRIQVHPDELRLSPELSRSRSAKQFEERLRSSIEEVGLAEPLKVAELADSGYVVIDGTMRLNAIRTIREKNPGRFESVAVYVLDYDKRFEIRYQSDIYQDLLPSQLAALVEYLHKSEQIRKMDIARYIGVSPATLRNFTGLWRLIQRHGLFAKVVDLMDLGVFPASNPYAWLRLKSDAGVSLVIETYLSSGVNAETWIDVNIAQARRGTAQRLPLKYVEQITGALPSEHYQMDEAMRSVKRDLGLRKSLAATARTDPTDAVRYLKRVEARTADPVLQTAARSLQEYLA